MGAKPPCGKNVAKNAPFFGGTVWSLRLHAARTPCVLAGFRLVGCVIFLDSSMVEHAAVNRGVVGSSPTRGVSKTVDSKGLKEQDPRINKFFEE